MSQALGLPLGIQDSDIDVCVPGTEELHRPVGQSVHLGTADGAEEEDWRIYRKGIQTWPKQARHHQMGMKELQC